MRHLVALLAIVVGCDAPPSAVEPPCGITIRTSSLTIWPPFEQLDLVVVADGSGLSPSARDSVAARVVRDLRVLATGDTDDDGIPDFRAYRSLEVAIVSADVGDDGAGIDGCAPLGRDGRFVSCGGGGPVALGDGADLDAGLAALECDLALAMTTTCPRARPLDAVRLALLPSSSTSVPSHVPHGDRAHAAFARLSWSDLAVAFVAPNDDCSGVSAAALDTAEACAVAADLVDPHEAYAELVALRDGENVVSSLLAGCADGAIPARPTPRLEAILPAWSGASAVDLCARDLAWLDPILGRVADCLCSNCLERPLSRGEDGLVDCDVHVVLPPRRDRERHPSCGSLGATTISGADTDHEVCALTQVAAVEPGPTLTFAYDDSAVVAETCGALFPPGQRLRLSPALDDVDPGTRLDVECRVVDVADAGVPACAW